MLKAQFDCLKSLGTFFTNLPLRFTMSEPVLLQATGLKKKFPGVIALDNVPFALHSGSVHAVCGENGAGKSTLMNILMGVYPRDDGEILLRGKPVNFSSPREALKSGISIIEQELNPIPDMTAAENLFLGREDTRGGVWIDYKSLNQRAHELLGSMGLDHINPAIKVKHLSLAQVQLLEIAKAASYDSDIIIMDEPTSAIGEKDTEILFQLINRLKTRGTGIVYVSHRMKEIFTITDTITVLRDGKFIKNVKTREINQDDLVSLMIGRKVEEEFTRDSKPTSQVCLETQQLSRSPVFEDISITLHKGEVLGIFGLMGSGRSEFLETLFGVYPADSGSIRIDGRERIHSCPRDAMRSGLGFVTEDRKGSGLVLTRSVGHNMSLASLASLSGSIFIDERKEMVAIDRFAKMFRVKTPSYRQTVKYLSGGNQQKVVLGKWLMTNPKILLLDEPTRGIDVGAKHEIYQFISQFAKQGNSVIAISSELPEVLGISDRIVVFRSGKLVGDFSRKDATEQKLMELASERVVKGL